MPVITLNAAATNYRLSDLLEAIDSSYRRSGRKLRIESLKSNPDPVLIGRADMTDFQFDMALYPGDAKEWISEQNNVFTLNKYLRLALGSGGVVSLGVSLETA